MVWYASLNRCCVFSLCNDYRFSCYASSSAEINASTPKHKTIDNDEERYGWHRVLR